jgi:nicotinamide mononucleotide transporter
MMSILELCANIFFVLSTLFASRNSVHTWWTGLISCSLFLFIFFHVRLYADVSLQFFYIGTCLYGWFQWKKGGKNKQTLPITHVNLRSFVFFLFCAILVSFVYGFLLFHLTNASNPFWDSLIMTLSLLGQFLVMNRKYENWFVWILVDSMAIPLYFSKGLHVTAALYCSLLCIAGYGLWSWKKQMKQTILD